MKAILVREHGGPGVLRYEDVDVPGCGPDEVLVEVRAASVNHIDLWIRKGLPGVLLNLPRIPGADAAGFIHECGPQVSGLSAGQRVLINPGLSCGNCEFCGSGASSQCDRFSIVGEHRNGTYAQYIAVPARNVMPIPDSLSFEEAAASPLVFLTAWSMMIGKGRLRAGEDVLVLGAGGGVATAAIQIAKLAGCRVFATASAEAKLEKARALGADFLINYATTDFDRKVRELTGKRGVDVVVDSIGADTWVKSLRAARKGGRVLTCGATTGYAPQTDLRQIFYRQVQVIGSTMGNPGEFAEVMRCLFRGQLRPIVDRVLPLSAAALAHEAIERREIFGKVVLLPWSEA